jgi:hypothetical protein
MDVPGLASLGKTAIFKLINLVCLVEGGTKDAAWELNQGLFFRLHSKDAA